MTSRTNLDHIASAEAETLEAGTKFDVVRVMDDRGNGVVLFLPEGAGQAVADAINAAVAAKGGE